MSKKLHFGRKSPMFMVNFRIYFQDASLIHKYDWDVIMFKFQFLQKLTELLPKLKKNNNFLIVTKIMVKIKILNCGFSVKMHDLWTKLQTQGRKLARFIIFQNNKTPKSTSLLLVQRYSRYRRELNM